MCLFLMIGLVTFICELENIFDLNIKIELVLFRKTATYFFFSHQTLIMTRAFAAADPNCFIILTKIYLRSKKRKENQLMIGKSRVNDILDYVLEKKTHLTEKNEWNIFFVKNSFQILTIFDIPCVRHLPLLFYWTQHKTGIFCTITSKS